VERLCSVTLAVRQLYDKAMHNWTVNSSRKDGAAVLVTVDRERRVSFCETNVCFAGDISMDRYVTFLHLLIYYLTCL
jgi:hypothetical protein